MIQYNDLPGLTTRFNLIVIYRHQCCDCGWWWWWAAGEEERLLFDISSFWTNPIIVDCQKCGFDSSSIAILSSERELTKWKRDYTDRRPTFPFRKSHPSRPINRYGFVLRPILHQTTDKDAWLIHPSHSAVHNGASTIHNSQFPHAAAVTVVARKQQLEHAQL